MGYKRNLKNEYRALTNEVAGIIGTGRMSFEDREHIAAKQARIAEIDARLTLLKQEDDYRGITGKKLHRTAEDDQYSTYLRGIGSQPEFRSTLDANALSTTGQMTSAGSTGYNAGFLIPQSFWSLLAIALKAYGGLSSQFQLLETPTGAAMPWATNDPTAIVGKYITEMNQLGFGGDSNGTDYQFGQGLLQAYTIVSGVILASVQLIQDSAMDVDNYVASRVGEAIGRKLAVEAFSGTGSSALLGINTALNARGSTGTSGGAMAATGGYVTLNAAQTVAILGNYSSPTTTELVGNVLAPTTLVSMIKSVDPAYYPNCRFYMNSNQAWNTRMISDGNGRSLLNFGNGFTADDVKNPSYNSASAVGQIMGFPVIIDNSISNLTASTTSGPIFGDLSKAMVLRIVRGDARVDTSHPDANGSVSPGVTGSMRLQERYADYLQVGKGLPL